MVFHRENILFTKSSLLYEIHQVVFLLWCFKPNSASRIILTKSKRHFQNKLKRKIPNKFIKIFMAFCRTNIPFMKPLCYLK